MSTMPISLIGNIVLVLAVCALAYRVFDMGVTVAYLEASLEGEGLRSKTLEEFQRTACLDIADIPAEYSAFEKDGAVFINSLRFDCIWFDEFGQRLFVHTSHREATGGPEQGQEALIGPSAAKGK